MYLGLSQMSDMTPFMSVSVLQCAVATGGSYTHGFTGGYNILKPYTMFVGPFFRHLAMPWHPEPFHAFRIGCFKKTFNRWVPLNVAAGWLCHTCVTGTWVTSWIDVILIWYHYIVICTLVTIFNWWLSSKDMKLRVLIKEVLVVFHWLTFRIICLYI